MSTIPVAHEAMELRGKPTTATFPRQHILYLQINIAFILPQRSFFFSVDENYYTNLQLFKMQRMIHPALTDIPLYFLRLREHCCRIGREILRAGTPGPLLLDSTFSIQYESYPPEISTIWPTK